MGELRALLEALGRLGGSVFDLAADRLHLLGIEAQEVKIRLIQILLLALIGAGLLLFALAMGLVAVMLVVPEPWRWPVAAGSAGVCLLAALVAFGALRRRVNAMSQAFSQTAWELKKDRACF